MRRLFCIAALAICALSLSAQTGTWSGSINVSGNSLLIVFNLTEGSETTMDVPDQHAYGIEASAVREGFNLKIAIPAMAATFEGMWTGKMIVGNFMQSGLIIPLTMKPGVPKINRPQTPAGPFPYTAEEVSFTNGDITISGTLTLPDGYSRETPALLMLTGSGAQDRDEEIFEHRPFAVIADAFARNGIATLRCDDRGCGKSTGNLASSTVTDLKNDALAGIDLLRSRFTTVGVLGHSEGGTFALMIAAEGKVDFAISLAGMVVSARETLLRQNREILLKAGIDQNAVSEYIRLLDNAFEAICTGTTPPSSDTYAIPDALKVNYQAVLRHFTSPYLKTSIAMDSRDVLDRIKCPVLALNGTKDTQVECEENLGALERGIKANLRCERIQDANHLFQHCITGETSEYKTIEETFAVEALQLMTDWVKGIISK